MRSIIKAITVPGLLLVTTGFIAYAQNKPPAGNVLVNIDSMRENLEGKPFPFFNARYTDGRSISSADLKDKIVFINFWFAACSPCIAEINGLNRLYDSVRSDRQVLFLTFTKDEPAVTREAVKRLGIRFPVINVSIEDCYRLNMKSGFPTNIVLDKKGIITWAAEAGTNDAVIASREIFQTGFAKIKEQRQ